MVATYKRLVVGVAILSSPQETYITYLAVKAGWDNAQIATYVFHLFRLKTLPNLPRTMLYLLISLSPRRDITLHVSTNNPAMVGAIQIHYNRAIISVFHSFSTTDSDSKQKVSLQGFMKTTWALSRALPKMHSGSA